MFVCFGIFANTTGEVCEPRSLARSLIAPPPPKKPPKTVPKAWTEFDAPGRMLKSDLRARVVDVAEELHKFTLLTRGRSEFLVDRYSEREEKKEKGRLLSQAEKEAEKRKAAAAATSS